MTRRKTIKLRNHITEMWNDGATISEIAHTAGISQDRVEALLKSARAGYHTPAQQAEQESR